MVAERGWEYNGLAFGAGSNIKVENVDGLYDAEMRDSVTAKAGDHGSFISASWLDTKRIVMEGNIYMADVDEFAAEVASLRRAFSPQSVIRALNFRLPGETERLVYCIPRQRKYPINTEYVQGKYAEWLVELIAGDPRVYSLVEGELTGAGTATNDGDFPTLPVVTFEGEIVNPEIVLGDEFVRVNRNVAAGKVLTIDFNQKTITEDGISVYGDIDLASTWFSLAPGDNELTSNGIPEVRWRHAWI